MPTPIELCGCLCSCSEFPRLSTYKKSFRLMIKSGSAGMYVFTTVLPKTTRAIKKHPSYQAQISRLRTHSIRNERELRLNSLTPCPGYSSEHHAKKELDPELSNLFHSSPPFRFRTWNRDRNGDVSTHPTPRCTHSSCEG